MKWRSAPDEEGYWWYTRRNDRSAYDDPELVSIVEIEGNLYFQEDADAWSGDEPTRCDSVEDLLWYGPLDPPEVPGE